MADVSPPRRASDPDSEDYRGLRRSISGDEVRVGAGRYSLRLRGSMVISVVLGLVNLSAVGYVIREQDRLRMELPGNMAEQHRILGKTLDTTMRFQTCVLALTPEELVAWRSSKWPQAWLVAMCPGLLLQSTEPIAP